MSVRYIVRKQHLSDRPWWTIRDAACRNCEAHNFDSDQWILYCWGDCDMAPDFAGIVARLADLAEIAREVSEYTDKGVTE